MKKASEPHQHTHPSQWLALVMALALDVQITWVTNGFPPLPRAWVLLWQTIPHLMQAWQAHGLKTGLAFAGLMLLSLMQAALWIGCLLLLWSIGKHVWLMPRQRPRRAPQASTHAALPVQQVEPLPLETTKRPAPLRPAPVVSLGVDRAEATTPSILRSIPATQRRGVPVLLEATSVAASSPWIACQVAVREGAMRDAQGMGVIPYMACFVVEGCGSGTTVGDAVCERVLDAATTALMASVTEASDHAVAAALRASVARAHHTLMQDNAAQRTFLTASLALCLLTAQSAWFIATGHTIVGRRRDGTWETGDVAAKDVWLGEQDVVGEGVELLHVMQHPLPDAEVMLLGAGAAWQAHGVAWFADAWASGSIAVPAKNVQQLVERVAASSPTGGALAGLLITGDRSVISAGITATVPAPPSICTR
jgi:hypothetical protein